MAITNIFIEENIFAYNLKFLTFVGLWHNDDWSVNQRFLYKIFENSLNSIAMGIIISIKIGTYQNKDDTLIFLSNLDKIIGVLHFFIKTIFFIVNRERFRILINNIIQSGDKITDDTKKLMISHVVFITVFGTVLISSFTFLGLTKFRLTAEAWMPFDPNENLFNFLMASQIIGVSLFVILFRNFAVQGLICSVLMYICEQLIDLQKRIRELEYLPEDEKHFKVQFQIIIQKHVRLIGYSRDLKNMHKEFFLVQNLAVTIELCLSAFMVILVGFKDASALAGFLSYLMLALLNAYIYCYLGNELIIQSQRMAQSAYETSWTSWPVTMQKQLLIVIMMSQKRLTLSAGGMADMSIQTFSQELYNGYSFFAVLMDTINF